MKRESTKHAIIAGLVFTITCIIALTTRQFSGAAMAQTKSIPVILNYAGVWIDQNGRAMEDDAAEKFLDNNPEYAKEILYLNGNKYYATGLQNEARSEDLDILYEEYVSQKWRESASSSTGYYGPDRDTSICAAILKEIVTNPPTENAFYKLMTHLWRNTAREDVKALQSICQSGEIKTGSTGTTARLIFFGMLAENYDSGFLDEVCGTTIMGSTSPQIPAILLADRETWLDQNGDAMDTERAEFFLRNNKEYAQEIAYLNNNPYYLPWREGTDDDEIVALLWDEMQLSDTSKESYYATRYAWVMEDIKDNPPSIEVLSEYQNKLTIIKSGSARYVSELIDYIEDGNGSFTYHSVPYHVFWSAIAKATEKGVFDNVVEK